MKNGKSKRGFTLVEMVVVLAIMGLAMTGIAKLLVDLAESSFITAEKLEINADIRQFTLEMADNARAANAVLIYKSFKPVDRNEEVDQLRMGNSGDFMLLVFKQPYPTFRDDDHITRLVGYFREADPNNPNSEGPVRRFDLNYHNPSLGTTPPGSAGPYPNARLNPVENLISHLSFSGSNYATVVQLSRGLANGQLFFNYLDDAVMIKAEIIHGNVAKRITDTYNYTVSPKG